MWVGLPPAFPNEVVPLVMSRSRVNGDELRRDKRSTVRTIGLAQTPDGFQPISRSSCIRTDSTSSSDLSDSSSVGMSKSFFGAVSPVDFSNIVAHSLGILSSGTFPTRDAKASVQTRGTLVRVYPPPPNRRSRP